MEGEARKPGERRTQILQTLAAMLQEPQPEKITTAALAARVGVSEAALYRHFSSKAQMYEGLIEFIEQTLFGLIARIATETPSPAAQNERLHSSINQLHDRIEAQLRQCLRFCGDKHAELSVPLANLLQCMVVGRWHQFAKSGFTRAPGGDVDLLLSRLLDVHPV